MRKFINRLMQKLILVTESLYEIHICINLKRKFLFLNDKTFFRVRNIIDVKNTRKKNKLII